MTKAVQKQLQLLQPLPHQQLHFLKDLVEKMVIQEKLAREVNLELQ
jgi:hypothetical protein